ncbi:MAG: bidirectional hydrogenase complex protein HoxE [Chloroflexi bacterium]|nr:bidirectional hydrogenase complex protein HoxE [Chloroflexota bacterium]
MRHRTKVDLPSDDKRWKMVQGTMRRNGFRPDALIETLHTCQEAFGYLDDEALLFVSRALHVSPSKVYGVATFYHFFNLKPQGEHTCAVCTGTACYIKGAQDIIDTLSEQYDIAPEQTTEDDKLSLMTVRCVGACGLAPAVVLDGEVLGNVTPDQMRQHIDEVMNHDDV